MTTTTDDLTARAGRAATGETVLQVRSLTKKYGPSTAVDEISFDLRRGEFLTLLGESGSGKSTTLMMVAGFETPDSGAIRLYGRDLTRMPAHKRGLGVVFQNYALFPNMTVMDNVAYPLKMRGIGKAERRERAFSALDAVRLTSHANHRPAELSGGQQQRVALARALVFNPEVLLMDEPLGALDKKLREHLQAEIRMLHRERGVTVIYVTHDQDEALSLSDRIAVMRDGRIEQIGAPHEIYSRPCSDFVADFVGEATIVEGEFISLPLPLLKLANGVTVPVLDDGRFSPGSKVGVMIRPEAVRFADLDYTENDEHAHLRVKVVDRGYYGRDLRFECRGIDVEFSAIVRVSEHAATLPRPGDEAIITWPRSAASAFPAGAR